MAVKISVEPTAALATPRGVVTDSATDEEVQAIVDNPIFTEAVSALDSGVSETNQQKLSPYGETSTVSLALDTVATAATQALNIPESTEQTVSRLRNYTSSSGAPGSLVVFKTSKSNSLAFRGSCFTSSSAHVNSLTLMTSYGAQNQCFARIQRLTGSSESIDSLPATIPASSTATPVTFTFPQSDFKLMRNTEYMIELRLSSSGSQLDYSLGSYVASSSELYNVGYCKFLSINTHVPYVKFDLTSAVPGKDTIHKSALASGLRDIANNLTGSTVSEFVQNLTTKLQTLAITLSTQDQV